MPSDEEISLIEELFERSGIPAATGAWFTAGRPTAELVRIALALREPRARLRQFEVNAALRRHVDGADHGTVRSELELSALMTPERAEKLLDFLEDPLFRSYIFVYSEGEELLRRWLEAVPPGGQVDRFRRLLVEQLAPATIVAETTGVA